MCRISGSFGIQSILMYFSTRRRMVAVTRGRGTGRPCRSGRPSREIRSELVSRDWIRIFKYFILTPNPVFNMVGFSSGLNEEIMLLWLKKNI